MGTRLTSVDELKDMLQIPAGETALDATLGLLIEEVSAEFDSFTNRASAQTGYSNEAHPGGTDTVIVNNPPIDQGATLQVKSFDGERLSIFDPSDYSVDYEKGIIRLIGITFSPLKNGAQVTYTGGFPSSGTGTAQKTVIDADVSRSVRKLAAAEYRLSTQVIDQDELDKVRAAAEAVWSGMWL